MHLIRFGWVSAAVFCGFLGVAKASSTGELMATYPNPEPSPNALFGHAVVELTFDALAVSAPGAWRNGHPEGAVYVIDSGSVVRLRIRRPEPQNVPWFGTSLAVDRRRLIVGDPRLGDPNSERRNVGAVHVFDFPSGRHLRTVFPPDPREADHFGETVLAQGGRIFVTALGEARDRGAIHVHDGSTFEVVQTLLAPQRGRIGFGRALDADGDLLVAGAPRADLGGSTPSTGAVFVFDVTSGSLITTLRDPEPNAYAGFGSCAAITPGGLVVVGSERSGKALLFQLRTGELRRTFLPPEGVRGAYGSFVASIESQVYVGSSLGWIGIHEGPFDQLRAAFEPPDAETLSTSISQGISLVARPGSYFFIGQPSVPADLENGETARDSGAVYYVSGFGIGPSSRFLRGDANVDGRVNLADVIWIVAQLYRAGPPAFCEDAADANDDGRIDLADALALINFQFSYAVTLPELALECGTDGRREDHLLCKGYSYCMQIDLTWPPD